MLFPLGVDDAKVVRRTASGALGTTKTDIVGISELSFGLESDTQEARGDNQLLKSRRTGKKVTGSVTTVATSLPLRAVISDGVILVSGIAPNIVTKYTEPATSKGGSYQIEAQAADDDGTATRVTILAATTTSGPDDEWAEGAYSEPSWDYDGVSFNGNLYLLEQFDTEAPIPA